MRSIPWKAASHPLRLLPMPYDDFHLLMPLYVCRKWEGKVTPVEGQTLKWVMPTQLKEYPMPPADKPLIAMLRDCL